MTGDIGYTPPRPLLTKIFEDCIILLFKLSNDERFCLKKSLPLILLLLLLTNCGTTTSLVHVGDEKYKGAEFITIVVSAPYEDLEIRSYIESQFKIAFANVHTEVHRAMDLLPPFKVYSRSEVQDIMIKNEIQCVLVVGVADYWKTYYSTPSKSVTKSKSSVITNYKSVSSGGLLGIRTTGSASSSVTSKSETTHIPGITLSKLHVKLDARLFAINSEYKAVPIWRANSTTSGDFFTKDSKVLLEAAYRIDSVLKEERVLVPGLNLSIVGGDVEYEGTFRSGKSEEKIFILGGPNYLSLLGCVNCKHYQPESPFNRQGYFGVNSNHSLWNACGIYASDTSQYSACNVMAKYPPVLVNRFGKEIGKLTISNDQSSNYEDSRLKKWLLDEICLKCTSDSGK